MFEIKLEETNKTLTVPKNSERNCCNHHSIFYRRCIFNHFLVVILMYVINPKYFRTFILVLIHISC